MANPVPSVSPDQETLPREADLGSIGRYRLLEKIGGGGMGVVFKARHLALQRLVAVKILHPHRGHLEHLASRFWREMEAAGKLDHPHVVRATDAGKEGDTLFLAMELVEGIDLDKLVRLFHPIPTPDVCELIRQAAIGLDAIRRADMVHRDIKPSNLMLSSEGVVKILDVGLALLRDDETKEELTPTGMTLGTADYLAPEQAGDSKAVDIRADIYSLGCTMYKLLAGHPPFSGSKYATWTAKVAAHGLEPIPEIDRRDDIPPEVTAILHRMTAKSRDARFTTPAEVAEALKPCTRSANVAAFVNENSLASSAALGEGNAAETPHAKGTTVLIERSPPVRRQVWRIAGAIAAVTLGAAMLMIAPWRAAPKQEPEIEKKLEPMPDLSEVEPLQIRNVIDRPPKEVLWNAGKGFASYRFNDKLQQLDVQSDGIALLGLGRTAWPRYALQVSMHQPRWTGGCGVFFGYRPLDDEERAKRNLASDCYAQFQYLKVLQTTDEKTLAASYLVMRGAYVLGKNPDGRIRPQGLPNDSNEAVDFPQGQVILELVIANAGLDSVHFGGKKLSKLTDTKENAKYSREDYRGDFGVFNPVSSTAYRNFHFIRHH